MRSEGVFITKNAKKTFMIRECQTKQPMLEKIGHVTNYQTQDMDILEVAHHVLEKVAIKEIFKDKNKNVKDFFFG
jgi:hypothetical protein